MDKNKVQNVVVDGRESGKGGCDMFVMQMVSLKGNVIFPDFVMSLFVGRQKYIDIITNAFENNSHVFFVLQKDIEADDVGINDLHDIGTICSIDNYIRLSDGSLKVLVRGKCRARLHYINELDDGSTVVGVEQLVERITNNDEMTALMMAATSSFENFVSDGRKMHKESVEFLKSQSDPNKFADAMAVHLPIRESERQEILEILDVGKRIEFMMMIMIRSIELTNMEKKIQSRVKKQVERNQKEYYLNEQLKAIHKELGQHEDMHHEIASLQKKVKTLGMPEEVLSKVTHELKKLRSLAPMSQESGVIRNYIDWVVSVPWKSSNSSSSVERTSISKAKEMLDVSHYGLQKVKDRIMEYLAVWQRVGKINGQIMCFFEPLGVGKTSLGQAIADAIRR